MAQSPAERQRAKYLRDKEAGMSRLTVRLPEGTRDELKRLWTLSGNGDSFDEWLAKCLVTGAKFRTNSGGLLPGNGKVKSRGRE